MALVLLPVLQKALLAGTLSRIAFMSSSAHPSTPRSAGFTSAEELDTNLRQVDLCHCSKLAWKVGNSVEKGGILVNATHAVNLVWTTLIEQLGRNSGWK